MNVFDTVQAARPKVAPMPPAERRMIRESLFGARQNDAARTISARSASGAVTSTAPHGLRIPSNRRRRIAPSSIVKAVAGIGLLIGGGVIAWSAVSDNGPASEATETTARPTTSAAATTTTQPPEPPPVRTDVSGTSPLVLPSSLLPVDEVSIAPPAAGSSGLLLTAPDGSTLWMGDFDGAALGLAEFDVQQVGALGVAAIEQPTAVSYRIDVPCGIMFLNDAPGGEAFRPAIADLLRGMSVDGDATLDATLPAGWSVLDVGASQTSYTTQFQVPVFVGSVAVRLVQIPDGSLPQLTFGGRQLAPVSFLGGPAYLDSAPVDPEVVSIFWQDDNTVFNASTSGLTFAELEVFINTLEPATAREWQERFAVTPVDATPAADVDCAPQPNFGPTLNP